jgi:hypothetical protein
MGDINIIIDTVPYLPDIYTKDNIFSSCDKVDNNTQILIDNTIFIFNIDKHYDSIQYNDPGYLLFGIQNSFYQNYLFPPLYFFNTLEIDSIVI